jgi:hypothetical protein
MLQVVRAGEGGAVTSTPARTVTIDAASRSDRVLLHDGAIDLRLGKWQHVLADVDRVDCVITDPPYSAKTHAASEDLPEGRQAFAYAPLDEAGAIEIVDEWAPRVRHWLAVMTDDVLAPVFRARMAACGLYDFAAIPIVYDTGLRIQGDGPASQAVYLVVGRPRTREAQRWRSLPGWYPARRRKVEGVLGAKDRLLTQSIVSHYSDPGHLVVDICMGSGTTPDVCRGLGRRCIGAEMNAATFAMAVRDVSRPHTADLFAGATE